MTGGEGGVQEAAVHGTAGPRPLWPPGFVWGAATSAFQVEGDASGRGRSVWDAHCAKPGRIADGSDARTAADHVRRHREDVALLAELGVDAYRFSVSWARVQPGGRGRIAGPGLDFYDRLVDALLIEGVRPWVTLYHADLPLELQHAGGWPHRDVADRFTEYALAVHEALGDRVQHWITLDRPWHCAWFGYGSGEHAPGERDHELAARAAHHLLLAHGRAVAAMRDRAPADHEFGIALDLASVRPADGREEDPEVADAVDVVDGMRNRWWLDALLTGAYPEDLVDLLDPWLDDVVRDGDAAEIGTRVDLLGVTYEEELVVDLGGPRGRSLSGAYPVPARITAGDTPGGSAGLSGTLRRITDDYPRPPALFVTGLAGAQDEYSATGAPAVADRSRVEGLLAQQADVACALDAGADVRAYFAAPLLDGFEWEWGYTRRCGLVHVDFRTQTRTPKESFEAYRDEIARARRRSAWFTTR